MGFRSKKVRKYTPFSTAARHQLLAQPPLQLPVGDMGKVRIISVGTVISVASRYLVVCVCVCVLVRFREWKE